MTAFAREQCQGNWGSAIWEIRTVNHRYLEVNVRLPESLRELESLVREQIRKQLYRGKVEVTLRVQTEGTTSQLQLNEALAQQLAQVHQQLSRYFPQGSNIDVANLLSWHGLIQLKDHDLTLVKQAVLAGLQQALTKLIAVREQEGAELQQVLTARLVKMDEEVAKIKTKVPAILAGLQKKMQERVAELVETIDPNRFEQELVILAQKLDVAEELDRLQAHIKEVKRVLQQSGAIGRRLDFLMQELNREANTIASKSMASDMTLVTVELKVLIEQMREQIQNIV